MAGVEAKLGIGGASSVDSVCWLMVDTEMSYKCVHSTYTYIIHAYYNHVHKYPCTHTHLCSPLDREI